MTAQSVNSGQPQLHTAKQVAEQLNSTVSWVKEQARRRRIPFVLVSGQYRFTDEHIAEIVRLFEVRPETAEAPSPRRTARASAPQDDRTQALRARPQRTRKKQAPAGASGEGPEKKGA